MRTAERASIGGSWHEGVERPTHFGDAEERVPNGFWKKETTLSPQEVQAGP